MTHKLSIRQARIDPVRARRHLTQRMHERALWLETRKRTLEDGGREKPQSGNLLLTSTSYSQHTHTHSKWCYLAYLPTHTLYYTHTYMEQRNREAMPRQTMHTHTTLLNTYTCMEMSCLGCIEWQTSMLMHQAHKQHTYISNRLVWRIVREGEEDSIAKLSQAQESTLLYSSKCVLPKNDVHIVQIGLCTQGFIQTMPGRPRPLGLPIIKQINPRL